MFRLLLRTAFLASTTGMLVADLPPPADAEELQPMSAAEFDLLKKTLLYTEDDAKALRASREILAGQTDALLDTWYGFVGANPHLLHFFTRKGDGKPDDAYLAAVRERFKAWVLDTAAADFDAAWLAKQLELGRRHHRSGKNRTDKVDAVENINYRYLPALIVPLYTTIRPYLAAKGNSETEVDAMQEAWRKALVLTVILWSQPYVDPRDF
jgi:hypothetical protein